MTKKKKFTLKNLLHRTMKVDLVADVVIGTEEHKDYVVSWVKVRGSQDPLYQQKTAKYVDEYYQDTEDAKEQYEFKEGEKASPELQEALTKINIDLMTATVACAIEEWDEDFFECKPTIENALKIFDDPAHSSFYNQITVSMKDAVNFLPIVG
tara:strand:- start:628 stop:1086 length:459 start_codon:yes stop_codon:yes gene_type:complete